MQKQVTLFTEKLASVHTHIDFSNWKTEKDFGSKMVWRSGINGCIEAYDTLNQDLSLAKLDAYGFDRDSLKVFHSYLTS